MDFSRPFQIDAEVSFQKLDDATVIVHLGTGRIHHTNTTGSRIWELIEQGRSPGEIVGRLESEFDAPPELLRQEVEAFLEQLAAEKMIHQSEAGA